MRPTHSQMITITDDMRANVAMVPALVVGLVLVLGLDFNPLGAEAGQLGDVRRKSSIAIFLFAWPIFALIYLLWTCTPGCTSSTKPSS